MTSHREMVTHGLTMTDDERWAAIWCYATTLDPVLASPRSRIIAVALLIHARDHGYEDEFLQIWREKRAEWVRTQTLWQRKWQRETRRPGRARHHDSISIRERYVRCQG